MKFALVNIPDHGFSGKGYTIPLGLAYIGSVVRNMGLEVKAYDLSATRKSIKKYYLKVDKEFINSIKDFRPDFIGITCSTTNRFNVKFWCGQFKNYLPDTNIIIGGPHPYFIPKIYLKTNPDVDVLVLGEGEKTIAERNLTVFQYFEATQNLQLLLHPLLVIILIVLPFIVPKSKSYFFIGNKFRAGMGISSRFLI